MTTSDTPFPETLGATSLSLRLNPAVVIGLSDFGGAALRLLAERLRSTHPALFEKIGWLWLTISGWQADPFPDPAPDPSGEHVAPVEVAPAPLARALDAATSQATVAALGRADYDVGATLDTIVVARADDPFTQGALWPLLDLIRAQPPLRENRVTLVLASDSRRFAGPAGPALAEFFGALAGRLAADRSDPAPGAIAWCYLCDALDVDSRLLGGAGGIKPVVQSQVELAAGFAALLVGSGLRRDPLYERSALPELAHDLSAPTDAALFSSFGLGAFVLPSEQIAALARDRLALRLHEAALPPQASVADREAAWSAYERFLAAADLSPQGLRDRLLRGPDGAPIRFDTSPPDLGGLDLETRLQALARWRTGLEERWKDTNVSPSNQIAGNADTLLDKLAGEMQREIDGLVGNSPRGVYQALAFLDELPQAIEETQIQVLADDSDFLNMTIPSADQEFRELGGLINSPRWWFHLIPLVLSVILVLVSFTQEQIGDWRNILLLLSLLLGGAGFYFWIHRRQSKRHLTDFISAVQLKFRAALDRETRARRRGILDGLSEVVRQERQALQKWQETLATVQGNLAQADVPPFQLACGERLLCAPADYPSPVAGYAEDEIAAFAAHYLDPAALPPWREGDAEAIVAWLREGAERALAGWRRGISVAAWRVPEPSQAVAELAAAVQPQWPLAANERRQVRLNVVGLPEREELILPRREGLGQVAVVSTFDPARLSYASTMHGLRLKKLAALRALWETPPLSPPRSTGGSEGEAGDAAHKTFAWRYAPAGEAEEHQINLILNHPRYQAFKAEPRPPRGQWGGLVTAPAPELDALADALSALHRQRDWSPLERAENVLAFTQQCFAYDTDQRTAPAGEWPRYPLETLVEGVGDCEDAVILAAAILKRLGYDVALLYYPRHCALGVAGAENLPGTFVEDSQTGVKYFYGETTAAGWSLGQVPPKYRELSPEGIEIVRIVIE